MKRFIYMVSAMALMLGLMAPAATADPFIDTAVIVFQGTATVCGQTVSGKPIATDCPIKPDENQGLYLPGQGPGPNLVGGLRAPGLSNKWLQRTGNYAFASNQLFIPQLPACTAIVPTNATPRKDCTIAAQGKLAPVAGIGAACGISHGYGGMGTATVGGSTYSLSNVGWPTSAGGVLPITGTYDLTAAGPGKTKDSGKDAKRIGPIVGAVFATGGQACLKSDVTGKGGASQFRVLGIVATL